MAQAYGSREHPVNLGPFRRIVNVHWRDRFSHLAFAVQLKYDSSDTRFHSLPPPDSGTFPPPPDYYGGEGFASTAFRYLGGAGPAATLTAGFSNNSWIGVDFDAAGMPSNPVSPFWFNRTNFTEDDRAIALGIDQQWHWVEPAGEEIDIPVPFHPGLKFKAGPASLEMYGPYYTGEKFAYQVTGDPVWLWQAAGPTSLSLGVFPPPEVQVEYKDEIFTMIGARVTQSVALDAVRMPRDSATPSDSGTLWVLLERNTG